RPHLTRTLMLEPERIERKNVEGEFIDPVNKIGYIRIRRFIPGDTCGPTQGEFNRLEARGADKFIIDLRGNNGGALHEGLCVGGIFLGLKAQIGMLAVPVKIPEKDLIHVFDKIGETTWLNGSNPAKHPRTLAVLVDSDSASAAEVLAGAIQYFKA